MSQSTPSMPSPQAYPTGPLDDSRPDDDPSPGGGGGGRRQWRIVAPVAAAAAAVVVAAGVLALQRGGGGPGDRPPMLHLVGSGAGEADTAAQAPIAGRGGAGPGYRVEGTLPTGPARGRVYTLGGGSAPRAVVSRLATALGVSGTPVREGDGWSVSGGGVALRVSDGAGWRWVLGRGLSSGAGGGVACHVIVEGRRACPPVAPVPAPGKVIPIQPPYAGPVGGANGNAGSATDSGRAAGAGSASAGSASASAGSASAGSAASGSKPTGSGTTSSGPNVGAPVAPDSPIGVPAPVDPGNLPRPDPAKVRAAASPVLAALGLDHATVRVETYPSLGVVTATPVVDGLPTSGFETRLSYDMRIRLVDASGWLGTPAAGREYPLVSAQRALERIPMPAIAEMPCVDSMPNRCRLAQPVVTGARPGLLLNWDESGAALLVPAWLYDVKGWPAPLAAVAVDPAYLAPPAPPVGKKLPGGGIVEPGTPVQVPPATAGTGSAGPGVPEPAPVTATN